MNTYSIGSDSPRWWWPSAAAGVAGAAAIAAILVLPAPVTTTVLDVPAPEAPAAPVVDDWVTTGDPALGRQCFALRARARDALAYDSPRCGHQPTQSFPGTGSRRPGLDSRP